MAQDLFFFAESVYTLREAELDPADVRKRVCSVGADFYYGDTVGCDGDSMWQAQDTLVDGSMYPQYENESGPVSMRKLAKCESFTGKKMLSLPE